MLNLLLNKSNKYIHAIVKPTIHENKRYPIHSHIKSQYVVIETFYFIVSHFKIKLCVSIIILYLSNAMHCEIIYFQILIYQKKLILN